MLQPGYDIDRLDIECTPPPSSLSVLYCTVERTQGNGSGPVRPRRQGGKQGGKM
jgi:hypothetical protein